MAVDRLPLADDQSLRPDLTAPLKEKGIEAVIVCRQEDLHSLGSDPLPHLALVDTSSISNDEASELVHRCSQLKLPVIALVPAGLVADLNVALPINDFIVTPADPVELVTRARQVLWRANSPDDSDLIRAGDLVINPANYDVSLKGRRINLRFKEYELLRFLATNPGRVYSREALLSQIWGYDYFGGTRTVDVHIRRLRSKIEDADHSFIETIWRVGYRFRDYSSRSP